jgi:signal transduction histidine kinase
MRFSLFSRHSIRQRLAFSICLQLLTVMLIFGGISYIGARKIALKLGLILSNDVTEKLNAEAELVSHRIMQQKLIIKAAIQVQEKEREEIGKELHDNINQILASTSDFYYRGDSKAFQKISSTFS